MKVGKIKKIYLALIAVISAVLILGLFALNSAPAYAEERTADTVNGSYYRNFIYSAEFTPNGGASRAGFIFGADENSSWTAVAETAKNSVVLYRQADEGTELKRVSYDFTAGEKLKITLVVNQGVVKMFIGSEDVAVLTCKADGYKGGTIATFGEGVEISAVELFETDTPDGDIYIGGYEVLKVVNLTDGNYRLDGKEYSLKGGVLKISDDYIRTLEADTEYSFKVVTSFTDFNFTVSTDFSSVSATPSIEKYYRSDDVTLELSASVKVHKLLLDGKECKFTQSGTRVVISSEQISSLTIGKHSVKLYTDRGRPETTINVSETVETVTEPEVKSNHVWLWIDLSIFAAAIIGYVTYSILKKYLKK